MYRLAVCKSHRRSLKPPRLRHLPYIPLAGNTEDFYLFFLLSSEKNEPRSAAAVIGLIRSAATAAVGGCGTRFAQTVLALFPPPAGVLPAR